MSIAEIVSLILAVSAFGGMAYSLYSWKTGGQGKTNAEAAGVLTDSSLDLVKQVREEMKLMKVEIDRLTVENKKLRDRITELEPMAAENRELRKKIEEIDSLLGLVRNLVFQVQSLDELLTKMKVQNGKAKPID